MKYRILGGVVLLLVVLFAANLFLGSARIPFRAVLGILTGEGAEKTTWTYIIWQTRFPQAVTALFAGASLAVAGLMLQTVFANPLAGPSILGIDSGASLGVALVMLLCGGTIGTVTVGLTFSGYIAVVMGAFSGAALILGLIIFFFDTGTQQCDVIDYRHDDGVYCLFGHIPVEFFCYGGGRIFIYHVGNGRFFRCIGRTAAVFLRDTVGRVTPVVVADETPECAFVGRALC